MPAWRHRKHIFFKRTQKTHTHTQNCSSQRRSPPLINEQKDKQKLNKAQEDNWKKNITCFSTLLCKSTRPRARASVYWCACRVNALSSRRSARKQPLDMHASTCLSSLQFPQCQELSSQSVSGTENCRRRSKEQEQREYGQCSFHLSAAATTAGVGDTVGNTAEVKQAVRKIWRYGGHASTCETPWRPLLPTASD